MILVTARIRHVHEVIRYGKEIIAKILSGLAKLSHGFEISAFRWHVYAEVDSVLSQHRDRSEQLANHY
jgi:hypothetical protein